MASGILSMEYGQMWLVFAVLCGLAALVVGSIALYKVENERPMSTELPLSPAAPVSSNVTETGSVSVPYSKLGQKQSVSFTKSFTQTPSIVVQATESLGGKSFDVSLSGQSASGFSFVVDLDEVPDLGVVLASGLVSDTYQDVYMHDDGKTYVCASVTGATNLDLFVIEDGNVMPGVFQMSTEALNGFGKFVKVSHLSGLSNHVMLLYFTDETTLHVALIDLSSIVSGDDSGTKPTVTWSVDLTINTADTTQLQALINPDGELLCVFRRTAGNGYDFVGSTKAITASSMLAADFARTWNVAAGDPTIGATTADVSLIEVKSATDYGVALYFVDGTTLKMAAYQKDGTVIYAPQTVKQNSTTGSAISTVNVGGLYPFGNGKYVLMYQDSGDNKYYAALAKEYGQATGTGSTLKPLLPLAFNITGVKAFPDLTVASVNDIRNRCFQKSDGNVMALIRASQSGNAYLKEFLITPSAVNISGATVNVSEAGIVNGVRPSSILDDGRAYYQDGDQISMLFNQDIAIILDNMRLAQTSNGSFLPSFNVEWIASQ